MSTLARLEDEWHDEIPVARVSGRGRRLERRARSATACARCSATARVALVVDLAATTYLDSAGINLLFGLADELRDRQQRLHLVVADGSPSRA